MSLPHAYLTRQQFRPNRYRTSIHRCLRIPPPLGQIRGLPLAIDRIKSELRSRCAGDRPAEITSHSKRLRSACSMPKRDPAEAQLLLQKLTAFESVFEFWRIPLRAHSSAAQATSQKTRSKCIQSAHRDPRFRLEEKQGRSAIRAAQRAVR